MELRLFAWLMIAEAAACQGQGLPFALAPERGLRIPPDAVFVVAVDWPAPLQLVDFESQEAVAFDMVTLPAAHPHLGTWTVNVQAITPVEPLTDGSGVALQLADDPSMELGFWWVVEPQLDPGQPPLPVVERVSLHTVRTPYREDGFCGSTAVDTTIRLSVCGRAQLYAWAIGAEPPAWPLMDQPRLDGLVSTTSLEVSVGQDLAAGSSVDVWIGAFDVKGRFSGWAGPERLTLPRNGYLVIEERVASTDAEQTDPCPVDLEVQSQTQRCRRQWGRTRCRDVAPNRAYASGCQTSPGRTTGLVLLGLLGLLGLLAVPRRERAGATG